MANDIRDLIIIGGGASGMLTGIIAAKRGQSVSILEHNKTLGKKLAITGNGRCNFTNLYQEPFCYNSGNIEKSYNIINTWGKKGITDLFSSFGIEWMIKKGRSFDRTYAGYVYPAGESAKEFVNILNDELLRLKVKIKTNISVTDIKPISEGFEIVTESAGGYYSYFAKKVVIACGGLAAPSTGSDGSLFPVIEGLGHTMIKPLPALTSVKTDISLFSGLRAVAEIKTFSYEEGKEELIGREIGEIQFTEQGLSGIPVMQLSGKVARAIHEGKKVEFLLDFYYETSEDELLKMLKKRRKVLADKTSDKFLTGFTYEKITRYLTDKYLRNKTKVEDIPDDKIISVTSWLKNSKFAIIKVSGFEAAQTTSGGVSMNEVTNNLESKFVPGLFFVGEVLDVDGLCGGYNLTWAFASALEVGNGGR